MSIADLSPYGPIAPVEASTLARQLIETSCVRQGIARDQLIIHSDRGPSMTSKSVAQLLAELGVEKSHSRPHVSNDNPYSEAHFKTMKYRPGYPSRFGSIEDARSPGRVDSSTGITMNTTTRGWR